MTSLLLAGFVTARQMTRNLPLAKASYILSASIRTFPSSQEAAMSGRQPFFPLLLCAAGVLVAACNDDRDSTALTSPSFAPKSACSATAIDRAIRETFTNNADKQTVLGLAQSLGNAYSSGAVANATLYGFNIMQQIETKGRFQGGAQPGSDLTVALFPCMKLTVTGSPALPTSVVAELQNGAYGVRGVTSTDNAAVLSVHASQWIIEPPTGKYWNDITTLVDRGLGTGDVSHMFLALGRSNISTLGFTATNDDLLTAANQGVHWTTVPAATFGNPYVVVGQCTVAGGFLQHNSVATENAEIFGLVQPTQCPDQLEAEQSTGLLHRLFQAMSPEPAYAATLVATAGSGGGAKPALSPFVIMNPHQVNPSFTQSPKKTGNTINKPLSLTPKVTVESNGGVPFTNGSVLLYLKQITNLGTPGQICNNWGYPDAAGVVTFASTTITKAGNYQLDATSPGAVTVKTTGTQEVPELTSGFDLSTAFQLKNDGSSPTVCPVFDGTTYFTDILTPGAPTKTFDASNPETYPPAP
jgi:hypothetical protein